MNNTSIAGMKRTHMCGELRLEHAGQTVTVNGWVDRVRDNGGVLFLLLRDRAGIVQCTFDKSVNADLFDIAFTCRTEFVVAVKGKLVARDAAAVNKKMPTGEVEIIAEDIRILSKAETTPFEIDDTKEVGDQIRLKYRYLDLRRPSMQKNLMLRHRVTQVARNYFDEHGFLEIETPMLTKSTPEGARDYLVPSRVHPGKFYALPQSPQQYKQLLMLSGMDRYIQITRCFRDEDLRADRQPEFTQIDLEMSFVEQDDVIAVNEGFLQRVFKEVLDVDIQLPLPRMTWQDAMDKYGSDKPDVRFGFEIKDISDIAANCSFKVFKDTVANGGTVRLINVNGYADKFPRKEIDKLGEFVKTYRAKGLAWMKLAADGSMTSSFAKFLSEDEIAAIKERAGAKENDLLFVVADADWQTAAVALGALRCELAKRLDLSVSLDFMSVSSYGSGTESSGIVKIVKDLDEPLEGKDVIIVEDIIDSGRTLAYLIEVLKQRNPKSIELCTLLDKPERRVKKQVQVKYTCFTIPDEFVVGYGLDYDQKYRNLPYIGVVEV